MIATKLAVLMAAAAIAVVGASATTISTEAEAQIAIGQKGVKADPIIAQEAGHWGTVNYIDQQACTNDITQAKRPEPRDDFSTGDQVQEVGTQSTECGDVTQSAEINNSVVDESTNNDESTRTTTINNNNNARPPED